ncbi:tyrosine-type recombinase/integrase [Actinacidiphila paucisporea]|uniref:Site-specific recombinase XerD n=1 Tax=Actinacidiphila paucisporea TaxID=310782 RepID=A0A1M6THH3_9ACTN|nr:site-specific integrase [Actinacidiphila paucisporea]SHK56364.1 Site-specific recombinase XerD [Actinacidiphila paucisporea]
MTEWSYTVRVWAIRKRPYRKPYQLRWQVGTRPHSESFLTSGLAESRRAELITAARAGEAFDVETGMPKSRVQKDRDISFYQHARNYMELKWDDAPAKTRVGLAETMATVTAVLVKDTKGMPDANAARGALYGWAFNKRRWDQEAPEDVRRMLAWYSRNSLPVSALSEAPAVRKALNACAKRLDGKTAAASVIHRKRAVFHQALSIAVEDGLLTENPLHTIQWNPPERVEDELDPECVPDPAMAEVLLEAVAEQGARGRHLKAFFGCLYYGGARPAEIVALGRDDVRLPRRGWGKLRLSESRPRAGRSWTDSGEAHDRKGLKHRPRAAVRWVPIPPELVALLRWHVTVNGYAPDGRLFRTARGGMVQESGYGEVWRRAREAVLSPDELKTKLAKRPYDLRHAAVSTWLSSGVEPQLVAYRAGQSVAVLFRFYAKFLKGGDDEANAKISARLAQRRAPA